MTDALDPNPAMTSQQDSGWLRTATVPDSTTVLSLSPATEQTPKVASTGVLSPAMTYTEETPKATVAKKPRRPYRQDVSLANLVFRFYVP